MSSADEHGAYPRAWRFYLDDMIGFAENVLTYTKGHSQDSFVVSQLNYDATLRNLEPISEAATHIPPEVRNLMPQIPWRQVIATRTPLIHGCLGIDNDILWSIIQDDIPSLGRFEKPAIPAKAGIQCLDLTGLPPARERRIEGFSRRSLLANLQALKSSHNGE